MAEICGSLWAYNFAKIVVVDVSEDYRFMQPSLPSDFYPVLREIWLPRHDLGRRLAAAPLIQGYLYDWHESPESEEGQWYVGVVSEELMDQFLPPPPQEPHFSAEVRVS